MSASAWRAPAITALLLLAGAVMFPGARAWLERPVPPPIGTVLVASDQVDDTNFVRTVVLVTRSEERVVGVILNRPGAAPHEPFFGGPVLTELTSHFVRSGNERGRTILPKVVWRRLDSVERAFPERRYAGLSVWSAEQLDREVRRGDWSLLTADAALIFDPAPETLWHRLRRRE